MFRGSEMLAEVRDGFITKWQRNPFPPERGGRRTAACEQVVTTVH